MKIAVTGASGLIGTALVAELRSEGHEVLRLVRRVPDAVDEVAWDPRAGTVDLAGLRGIDAAVHLAGAGVGDKRWTAAYKKTLLDSRVEGTTTLSRALASLEPLPRVLVSASGMSYYGSTGERAVDESAPRGDTFLADVAARWEAATAPASDAGIRVALARTSLVAARHGGAFQRLLLATKVGLGGRLGPGTQWWSLISLRDQVRALRFAVDNDAISGPMNVAADAARQVDVARKVSALLHRPHFAPAPAFALNALLGGVSIEILGSIRVVPRALTDAGFSFLDPDVDAVLATLVDA